MERFAMAVREFIDSSGVTWRVWNTRPSRGEMLSGEFEHGWLTFESADSLRRCTPIPSGWETAPPKELERMCLDAPETRRISPSRGTLAPDEGAEGSAAEQDAGH
jgi:hypothetical protein